MSKHELTPPTEVVKVSAQWIPTELALPPRCQLVLLRGLSGYSTHREYIETGVYDPSFRPRNPWIDVTMTCMSDRFGDGHQPTHWRPLADLLEQDFRYLLQDDVVVPEHVPYQLARETIFRPGDGMVVDRVAHHLRKMLPGFLAMIRAMAVSELTHERETLDKWKR